MSSIPGIPGDRERLLVNCVPMLEQNKNDEKGLFPSWLASFWVGKCYLCRNRVCLFLHVC